MDKFLSKKMPIISFVFIPVIYFYDPDWLKFLGSQPYWPLFWLLPWSMIYGSLNGLIVGIFLGLFLDSLGPDFSYSQLPSLALCGFWFGRFKTLNNSLVEHLRYGLICAFGSFLCGTLYFFQILIKNFSDYSIHLYLPSIKNIMAQVFITAFLAPFFCSRLLKFFKNNNERNNYINLTKK